MTNDEKDRHVLAAAVYAHAETIVTFSAKDFKVESREPYGIALDTPDEFLSDRWFSNNSRMARALVRMSPRLTRPPIAPTGLIDTVLRKQAPRFANEVLASDALQAAMRAERDEVPMPDFRTF